jgi:hypothetical protein
MHAATANANGPPPSIAEALESESKRLRDLAEQLRLREQAYAELQAKHAEMRKWAFVLLREKMGGNLEPLPDDCDLEAYAKEQGALALEDFIDEVENPNQEADIPLSIPIPSPQRKQGRDSPLACAAGYCCEVSRSRQH